MLTTQPAQIANPEPVRRPEGGAGLSPEFASGAEVAPLHRDFSALRNEVAIETRAPVLTASEARDILSACTAAHYDAPWDASPARTERPIGGKAYGRRPRFPTSPSGLVDDTAGLA